MRGCLTTLLLIIGIFIVPIGLIGTLAGDIIGIVFLIIGGMFVFISILSFRNMSRRKKSQQINLEVDKVDNSLLLEKEKQDKIVDNLYSKANNIEISKPTDSFEVPVQKKKKTSSREYIRVRKLTNSFVVLDFETTGLDPNRHNIVSYGVVEYLDGERVREHSQLVNPERPIPSSATKIHGITDEMVEGKPTINELIYDLYDKLRSRVIVAHNAPYDMKFLLKALKENDVEYNKFRVIDTVPLSRKFIWETENHKLTTLNNYFGFVDGNLHDSLNDAIATGELLLLLIERSENV